MKSKWKEYKKDSPFMDNRCYHWNNFFSYWLFRIGNVNKDIVSVALSYAS